MQNLPSELLGNIIVFTSFIDQYNALKLLSKSWNENVKVNLKRITAIDLNWCHTEEQLILALNDIAIRSHTEESKLNSLTLFGPGVTPMVIGSLADATSLRKLIIESRQLDFKGISGLSKLCNLEYLTLKCESSVALRVLSQELKKLVYLDVSCCSKITDSGIIHIAKSCDSLSTIAMRQCYRITDNAISTLANLRHASLTSIDIRKCIHVTDEGLCHLASRCTQLKFVCVAQCPRIRSQSVTALAMSSNDLLGHLDLGGCVKIGDHGIQQLACLKSDSIKYLDLSGLKELSASSFEEIALNMKTLIELNLTMCTKLQNDSLSVIAKGCQHLEVLSLQHCTNIDDYGILAVAENCSRLRKLELNFCFGVTDLGLCTLVEKCKNLNEIDLRACNLLTVSSFEALAYQCSSLKRLVLGGIAKSEDTTQYVKIIRSVHQKCMIMNF